MVRFQPGVPINGMVIELAEDTGRHVVVSYRTGRTYAIEPLETGGKKKWGMSDTEFNDGVCRFLKEVTVESLLPKRDYFNQFLKIGDEVAFYTPGYRDFSTLV